MNLIKLDAIDSTNDFLKLLNRNQELENYTVVTAQNQTNGKGQMGNSWISESGKNLIMSILIKDVLCNINQIFDLNVALSLAVFQALENFLIPNLSIKWSNDIMSDSKKIGGILIENSFKSNTKIESVVGIGLNVNQIDFSELPNASSLSNIMKRDFNLDDLIASIYQQIKENSKLISSNKTDILWENYLSKLFKINVPMAFEDANKNRFMGIINTVTRDGKLQIILEDDAVKHFKIKEITMLY
ncbi:MAG: biotin--[acetyl-CoA-carboxylase] ligase [Flavobacterium sp.]|nr:biotin--[acetyl-CoA-carboxylase] ligase [Flavobacterium sp.]